MKLVCLSNFEMLDGDIAFSMYRKYEFTYLDDEYYVAIDDQGASHQMHVTDLLGYFVYMENNA